MLLPHGDETLSAAITQIYPTSSSGDEVVRGNLASAHDGYNEAISHGTQFFRQVKGE